MFCLVIPFRRIRPLVAIVTAFTVAHSITLIASAAGFAPDALWFPPLIEVLIALSIVYMALENIVGAKLERRWMIAFGFGLVHGFGFSFALRESLQFAGAHLATSLVSFNVGVELGQLRVLAVAVPALNWFCSSTSSRSGWGRSSSRRSWRTRRGTGCSIAVLCSPAITFALPAFDAGARRERHARPDVAAHHRRGGVGRVRALRPSHARIARRTWRPNAEAK